MSDQSRRSITGKEGHVVPQITVVTDCDDAGAIGLRAESGLERYDLTPAIGPAALAIHPNDAMLEGLS